MAEINWGLLQPVDIGSQIQQGFATGAALVKGIQTQHALQAYLEKPDDPHAYSALAYLNPEAAATAQRQHMLQRKETQDAQDRQRAVALGELYNADPQGAREEAISAGDFDLAKTFNEMDENAQKRTAEFWKTAGPLAYRLKQIQDPAARQQLFQQALPILRSSGADEATLSRFDPTNDAMLDAAITTAQTIPQLIDQGKVTWHQRGEFGEYALDSMGRPVGKDNPYAATGGSQPAAAPASSAPPAAAAAVGTTLAGGGLKPQVVAGFLGNFDVEGGYGGARGDGGSSHGIIQLHSPDRIANFEQVIGKAPDEASPEETARFVLWELQNPKAAGMTEAQRDAIVNAPDAATAAALIDQHYERSSGQHRHLRIEAARRYAENAGAPHAPDAGRIRAQAAAAIAAGADAAAVKARAASMGVDL